MNDADQVVVAANGRVLVAPVGTAAPADIATAPTATWVELGYINPDGVAFSDGKTIEDVNAWQSFYPIRKIMTGKESTVAFSLLQWSKVTVPLAFGGGTVTEPVPGSFRYTPPAPGSIDERAMLIEWEDGTKNYRLVLPRGLVSEDVETNLVRAGAGELPITFAVLGSDGTDAWYLDTDDPAFDPAP